MESLLAGRLQHQRADRPGQIIDRLLRGPTAEGQNIGNRIEYGLSTTLGKMVHTRNGGHFAFAPQQDNGLLTEMIELFGQPLQPAAIQGNLIEFTLQICRTLRNVRISINDQADNRAFNLHELAVRGQLKDRQLMVDRCLNGQWADFAGHSHGRYLGPPQAADNPLQSQLGIEAHQVFHIDQRQLVAIQLGEGWRAGTQAAGPTYWPVEVFGPGQELCARR